MTEQVSLGLLIALGILVNLYGLIVVRDVHRITNETLLTTRTTLDAAIQILHRCFWGSTRMMIAIESRFLFPTRSLPFLKEDFLI